VTLVGEINWFLAHLIAQVFILLKVMMLHSHTRSVEIHWNLVLFAVVTNQYTELTKYALTAVVYFKNYFYTFLCLKAFLNLLAQSNRFLHVFTKCKDLEVLK